MNIVEIKRKPINELTILAKELNVPGASGMRRQDLIFSILQTQAEKNGAIYGEGVLETLPDGFGFLRAVDYNYLPGPDDIYVSPSQIRRFSLRTGDTVSGEVRPPKEGEKYFALLKVDTVNFEGPDQAKDKILFDNLTPLYPDEKLEPRERPGELLHADHGPLHPHREGPARPDRLAAACRKDRAAQGHRQQHRRQPPGSHPHRAAHRRAPRRSHRHGAIASRARSSPPPSTSRRPATSRWPRWSSRRPSASWSTGKDVVILLDSITRLARAYNTVVPPSGKILSGGVDSNALHKPKRFFGAARNIEDGGSLTIIATALIDTGSRMDEVIFEEFKGTGNMEIILDRRIADRRVFPAIDLIRSGTRKEELLTPKEHLNRVWILRRLLQEMNPVDAIEFIIDKMRKTQTNKDFFDLMSQ